MSNDEDFEINDDEPSEEERRLIEEVRERDLAVLREACRLVRRHFDHVQIFANRDDPGPGGDIVGVHYGDGNWYARFGQVVEWAETMKGIG